MRIHFKTKYDDDINLFEDGRKLFWYVLLVVLAILLPFIFDEYLLGEAVNVLIWAIAGMGLMILAGHTGQASLGHGAFLACGAYMEVWLQNKGVPFVLSLPLAGLFAGIVGAIIAIPALKMSGIYLAIATLAMGVIAEDVIILLEPYTGGIDGVYVEAFTLFGVEIDRYVSPDKFYWTCLGVVIIVTFGYANLLRSSTGRAFMAIRDSEISARAMGINVARFKTISFGLSCFVTGIAGGLLAHYMGAFNYEAFLILISIQLLLMIVVGGMGSIHGAFFGAAVVGFLPQLVTIVRETVTTVAIPGLDMGIFALILITIIVVEPTGLYGRWMKTRIWFELFPLARKDMFRRNKSYLKTERMK
ncbi:MAG: branched-chain amino acid ABC transporter permease [Rhizobiaceae bacterium]|nr:branched-chain amino acid ABC transporter permease [Rhizobiaceae bacterium]MBL4731714.1 branched-chain amino acid ABC transporter permease [Rhizobiaceae bacterium]